MARGKKTGGRTPGTVNRRTADIQSLLASLGCDPIEGMARIAMNHENPIEIRAKMYSELAQYVAPKRKALAVSSNDHRIVFNIGITRHPVLAAPEAVPLTIEG